MKCYIVNGKGIDQLKMIDCPNPQVLGEYDVLVDVKACSLNYRDLMVAKGQYGAHDLPPFVPVSDMAGVVKSVGKKVTTFKPGDRVVNAPFRHFPAGTMQMNWAKTFIGGNGVDGVLAEQIVYPEDSLVVIPAHLSFEEASTFTIAGLTAWSAVVTHGKTRPGEWVLLQGTGGVSIFAAQLAKAMGARTILTTSSDEKGNKVKKELGVTETVNYKDPDWDKKVLALTGKKGVDVVVDVTGGETLTKSLGICNFAARVAVIGVLAGTEATIKIRDLLYKQVAVKGIFMESTQEFKAFMQAVDFLKLKPHVDKTFSFDHAVDAYKHLDAQKHVGKVVITL